MRSEIVLIGPPNAGKSTQGALLAQALGIPQVSLDELRWGYYRELGFDDALAEEIRQKGGFVAIVAYWCLFNSHAVERLLADHADCVFDLGAGPIIFDNLRQRARIHHALDPFTNVVRLLPSPDLEQSIAVLRKRGGAQPGSQAQGFDWSAFFVRHVENRRLAKFELYTAGQTPAQTCRAILAATGAGGD